MEAEKVEAVATVPNRDWLHEGPRTLSKEGNVPSGPLWMTQGNYTKVLKGAPWMYDPTTFRSHLRNHVRRPYLL